MSARRGRPLTGGEHRRERERESERESKAADCNIVHTETRSGVKGNPAAVRLECNASMWNARAAAADTQHDDDDDVGRCPNRQRCARHCGVSTVRGHCHIRVTASPAESFLRRSV